MTNSFQLCFESFGPHIIIKTMTDAVLNDRMSRKQSQNPFPTKRLWQTAENVS